MITIRSLGLQPYSDTWEAMRRFTDTRDEQTPDEIWLLQHHPVYTQGQAGKPEHILNQRNIPLIQSDRGGQVTYHGPGQLIAYVLIDLRRRNLGVRTLVCQLERVLIELLDELGVAATTQAGAPGVYVHQKKIASLGLRVRKGCTYHGLAFNIAMDLTPFLGINPCGYTALEMTQLSEHNNTVTLDHVESKLKDGLLTQFGQASHAPIC